MYRRPRKIVSLYREGLLDEERVKVEEVMVEEEVVEEMVVEVVVYWWRRWQ